ncbi:hypothetical protein GFS24_10515 [Chitinophaga sp. SYP-B3965]|uniref:iron chaperone n=1 Tax=Chitinophaga sp. SYP-B3965 TaxID=2663120 RepID=UPI00129983FF|nr:DUF1801 domain-containing protein [Chitinophaga sp. SYP-B3965]MRG45550.1 hypothetical protein [Chitinophaga sp. SYP-B3965]
MKAIDMNAYIAGFPKEIQDMLEAIRAVVKKTAPAVEETIKYDMPTFMLHGKNLIHFAAFKKHIGFFGAPTGNEAFAKDFTPYKSGKGTLQFPYDKPMPLALITKIVKFRVKELG